MSEELFVLLLSKYVEQIVELMCDKYGFTPEDALRQILASETYVMLSNPKLEMMEFCPDVIFEMWECERVTGNPRNSIYIRSA